MTVAVSNQYEELDCGGNVEGAQPVHTSVSSSKYHNHRIQLHT